MPGQQGYIYQKNNKLLSAALSGSVKDSNKAPLIYPVAKKGNGNIKLYGNYNGALDAAYEIKVIDTALENPHVSSPVFKGAGSGKMSAINVNDLLAQDITVLCLSTGTDTKNAVINIEGLEFKAKTAGSTGNAIYILVDDSPLQFTGTDYSLISQLKAGDNGLTGPEWDFDTKALAGYDDLVPAGAHRVAFGQNKLNIYLQYKKYDVDAADWEYYFIPSIRRDTVVGDKVYFVTEGRKVTVTDGVTTEVYSKIISMADFWNAIKDNSTLIEPVASAIDNTRAVTSPVCMEFDVKTDAFFLPPYKGQNSSDYAGKLESIVVTNNAKTETIKIECVDNSFIGSEIFNVKGSATGDMGQVQAGVFANFGFVGFLVPQVFPKDWGNLKADWSHKVEYMAREESVDPPAICFDMKLGIASQPQTLTLEYKKRPEACFCTPGAFSDKCLGLTEEGGELGMAYTVPDLLYWTDVVYERMREKLFTGSALTEHAERGTPASYSSEELTPANVKSWWDNYINKMKTLAARIMALTEDDTATLTTMVDQYKQLVNSFTVTLSGVGKKTWNESEWSTATGLVATESPFGWYAMMDIEYDTDLLQTITDSVLLYERTYGLKKNSIVGQGTCYIDSSSQYYWEVRGAKAYLPAYTDIPYYATIKQGDEYVNTKEFAFLIETPCGGSLMEGDQIIVTIGEASYEKTYQLGDLTYLPTIAKQNLYLTGGIDGDDTYIWSVQGTLNAFPDYLLDRDDPQAYIDSKLTFKITDGIIPFQVGDSFEFSVEGGHFIWRKDSGAWSASVNIEQEIQTFDSGLRIGFDFGVSPSFVIDDTWEVLCIQDNKKSNLLDTYKSLKWRGSGNFTIDMGSSIVVNALIIDAHTIGSSFTLRTSDAPDFSPEIDSLVITPADLICKLLTFSSARYYRLEFSGDVDIGFLFLGSLMTLSLDADEVTPNRSYEIDRQNTKEPFSLLKHSSTGYSVGYKSMLVNNDFELIDEMISYLKKNNDQPVYFIANTVYPEDCIRGRVNIDNIQFGGVIDVNAPKANRVYSLTIPIEGKDA